jgi:hypothetical protein
MRIPDDTALKALLDPLWRVTAKVRDRKVGWGLRVTPPFPEPWPAPTELVLLAYATGLAPPLVDGEHVSRPFAVMHLSPEAGARVDRIAVDLEDIGAQGVRPLNGAELEIIRTRGAVYEELAQLPTTLSPRVSAYFAHWLDVSGVIARTLPAPQRRFLAEVHNSRSKPAKTTSGR